MIIESMRRIFSFFQKLIVPDLIVFPCLSIFDNIYILTHNFSFSSQYMISIHPLGIIEKRVIIESIRRNKYK